MKRTIFIISALMPLASLQLQAAPNAAPNAPEISVPETTAILSREIDEYRIHGAGRPHFYG